MLIAKSTDNKAEDFGQEYFSASLSSATFRSPKFKEEFGLIEKFMLPRAGDKILDVGCGKGLLGFFLLDKEREIDMVFSDISPESEKYLAGFNFVKCAVTNLPFKDNNFDKIFCFHVISHVGEAKKALEEIRRVAKPGGRLMIVTPNIFFVSIYRLASFFRLIPKFQFDKTAKWLYGRGTLARLLKKSGWRPERVETFGVYPSKFLRFNFLKKRVVAVAVKGYGIT